MSPAASILANDPDTQTSWAQDVLRRQVALLEQLAEQGLRLARGITDRALGDTNEAAAQRPGEAAMAFSRVARAVRMTALLQSRLLRDMDDMRSRAAFARSQAEEAAAEDAADAARLDPAYRHKARVEAIVVRVAKAETDDEDRIDRIVAEAGERLDDEDIYGDVLTRPVGELVALICRDLGLAPDWGRLTQEAWAAAEGITPSRLPSIMAVSEGEGDCQRQLTERPQADPGLEPGEEPVVVGAGSSSDRSASNFLTSQPPCVAARAS